MPGVEPRPYILRFTEDKPNPLYRRICYTFAWNAVLSFALLNLAGLVAAAITNRWYLKQIYNYAYFPLCLSILILGALGRLPRVGLSTKGEGIERRYFYGSVWAVTIAQTLMLALWKTLPLSPLANAVKLGVYLAALACAGAAASLGLSAAYAAHCSWPTCRSGLMFPFLLLAGIVAAGLTYQLLGDYVDARRYPAPGRFIEHGRGASAPPSAGHVRSGDRDGIGAGGELAQLGFGPTKAG